VAASNYFSPAGSRHSITHYVYNQEIKYEPGYFEHHKQGDEGILSSPSRRLPESPQTQMDHKIVPKDLKEFEEEEMVLKRIIPGKDGRERIHETNTFPYSIYVQLEMEFNNGTYLGSGSLIGPHHLLTCAHNVFSHHSRNKCFAKKIEIYPGRNKEQAPFGKANVTKAYIYEDWSIKKDKQFDIALLILDHSIGLCTCVGVGDWRGVKEYG